MYHEMYFFYKGHSYVHLLLNLKPCPVSHLKSIIKEKKVIRMVIQNIYALVDDQNV